VKLFWPFALFAAFGLGKMSRAYPEPEQAAKPQDDPPFVGSKVKNLFRRALAKEFTQGREILVDIVEVPPNTTLDRHWHPGEEFHYYLQGEPEVSIGRKPAVKAKQGTVGHIPFKAEHLLSTKAKGAKILVFRVHTAGQPMRHLVKGDGHNSH
jgi:quercetin dioxygenase-like cupin family protein